MRSIILTGDGPRLVLEGLKTQSRCVIKPQPPSVEDVRAKSGSDYHWYREPKNEDHPFRAVGPVWAVRELNEKMANEGIHCPWKVGDKVYVKECWRPFGRIRLRDSESGSWEGGIEYRAGLEQRRPFQDGEQPEWEWCRKQWMKKNRNVWRSPSHLPQWASRLTLEITEIRCERLNAITADDVVAEGIEPSDVPGIGSDSSFVRHFASLWNKANRAHPWESNCWCWVRCFKVDEKART